MAAAALILVRLYWLLDMFAEFGETLPANEAKFVILNSIDTTAQSTETLCTTGQGSTLPHPAVRGY